MATAVDEVVGWATDRLGCGARVLGVDPVAARTVVRLVDGQGGVWFAKRPSSSGAWQGEVRAYQRWAPVLPGRLPVLRAWDDGLRVLLLGELPGLAPPSRQGSTHRSAGRLLRALHEHAPVDDGFRVLRPHRAVRAAVGRLPGVLTAEQKQLVLRAAAASDELPEPALIACHGDFAPRNWRVLGGGRLGMLDFSDAGQAPAVQDMTRLLVASWWGRPGLVRAFLRGYGRALTDVEKEYLRLSASTTLVRGLATATRRGNVGVQRQKLTRLQALVDGYQPELADRA